MTIDELHRRLGHVSHDSIRHLIAKGLVEGVELDLESKPTFCSSCEWGKGHRKAITKIREDGDATAVGEEVHSDIWGPASVETINHKEYFISFTDGHSRYTIIYLIRKKSEAFDSYQRYEAWLETQHKVIVKCLCTDRGGEYRSHEFDAHLELKGTVR